MTFSRIFARNARTALSNPAMVPAYARWLVGLLIQDTTVTTRFGTQLGGFENFSNYWGTIFKIPSEEEFDFMASFLKSRNAVFLDVGSNVGSFAVVLGRRLSACSIHAFEPAPNTFRILQANVARNQLARVHVHQIAIADRDGTVRFSNEPRISQRNRIILKQEPAIESCEVCVRSLDSFCETNGIEQVGFIKIDCEGAEPLVLRGGRSLLQSGRIAAILIEVCPRNLRALGFCVDDLLAVVENVSYSFHRFEIGGAVGRRLTRNELNEIESEDVLLLPR